ncbi:hypothetical protein D3C76_1571560 [compost metagenome]
MFAPAVTDDTGTDSTVGEHFLEQFEVIEQEVIGVDLIGQQGDVDFACPGHQVRFFIGTRWRRHIADDHKLACQHH